jgi:hypothetical protein
VTPRGADSSEGVSRRRRCFGRVTAYPDITRKWGYVRVAHHPTGTRKNPLPLTECIGLFSTVEREGQLSGKPTRPSTSYRQPARASSGDAPAEEQPQGNPDGLPCAPASPAARKNPKPLPGGESDSRSPIRFLFDLITYYSRLTCPLAGTQTKTLVSRSRLKFHEKANESLRQKQ